MWWWGGVAQAGNRRWGQLRLEAHARSRRVTTAEAELEMGKREGGFFELFGSAKTSQVNLFRRFRCWFKGCPTQMDESDHIRDQPAVEPLESR